MGSLTHCLFAPLLALPSPDLAVPQFKRGALGDLSFKDAGLSPSASLTVRPW